VNDLAVSAAVRHERIHTRAHTAYQDSFTPFDEGDPRSRANVTTYRASLSQRFPDLAEGGKFRVVFASSFRHPSLVDLFSPGTLPNPDLRPERGKSVEMGWDQSLFGGKAALSVTVFHNRFRDLIKFSYVPAAFKFTSENIGRAQMEGFEATWRQKWAAGFYSTFSYTYLDARDLDADELLIRRPRHSGFLRVGYAHHEHFDVGVEALRSGTRPDDPFGGPFPDALHPYTLANAFGTAGLGHGIFIELRATNLLDENYESTGAYPSASRGKVVAANAIGFPLPRRSYHAGLRWEF
jgi:vitamin B12 transporter